jgi:hypothetical protein
VAKPLQREPDSIASPESHSDVLAKRSQRLLDGLPLAFPGAEGFYTLRATDDTPYFHHVATLAELQRAADPKKGKLYTFHFNALRSVMEKTASFFGHPDIAFCLQALNNEEDLALYNRALNLLSHGKYAIHEPVEMGEDNQELFRRILRDFVTAFQFALPEIGENPTSPVSAP